MRRFNLACSELPALVEQIDSALADGDLYMLLDGERFALPEKLLRGIRTQFSSYAVSGGSDANVVRNGVSTPKKTKASARADGGSVPKASSPSETAGSVGRQFNEERRIKNEELVGEVARIVGEELRKAVMPLLAEIDTIAALINECALEVSASKPARKRNAGKYSTDRKTPIFTRRGRTSVVVGSRKVS